MTVIPDRIIGDWIAGAKRQERAEFMLGLLGALLLVAVIAAATTLTIAWA